MASNQNELDSIVADSQTSGGTAVGEKMVDQQNEHLSRYQTASSVVIPREVFESMYLSPYNERKGHLRSTFANPTPMSVLPSSLLGFIRH